MNDNLTDDERRILKSSQDEIKKESQNIGASMTRILMLGGPIFVDNLLNSLLEANKKIKEQLGMSLKVAFSDETYGVKK